MHERNPYKIPPDFDSLARAYPPLRPQSVRFPRPLPSMFTRTILHSITRTSDNAPPTVDFYDETAQRSPRSPLLFRLSHFYHTDG
jgi:hypothetical protein